MSRGAGAGGTGPRFSTGRRSRTPSSRNRTLVIDLEELAARSGRITALEQQKDPQRRSLFIDGEFALGLDLETVVRSGFRVGQEVEGPALVKAYHLDQRKRAWDGALAYLAASPRTAKEIGRRLGRIYPPELVAEVIEKLAANGWVDDRAYAEAYIRSHREHGARRLLADLVRKGVEGSLATQVIQERLAGVDATEQAREVAVKRLCQMGEVDQESAWRRLAGFLARRGFSPDVISQVLSPLLHDVPRKERPQGGSTLRRSGLSGGHAQGGLSRGGAVQGGFRRGGSLLRRRSLRQAPEEEL